MAHRIECAFRRPRELRRPRDQQALHRIDRAHALLHFARSRFAVGVRHHGGAGISPQVSAAWFSARRIYPADDGNTSRGRAGVDDDVPPAAGRAELSAVTGGLAGVAMGLFPALGHSEPGDGRDLALDAARNANRTRWLGIAAGGAAGVGDDRWRDRLADVSLHHVAAARPIPDDRRRHPHDRRAESVRHDLRDFAGRTGDRVRDDQHLPIPAGVLVLQHRDRLGSCRGFFVIVIALSLTLLVLRERAKWSQ